MKKRHSDEYFKDHIWKYAKQMAEDTEIRFTAPNSGRRTGLPRRFHNGHVLEFTSFSDQTTLSLLYESLKVI